MAGCGRSAGFWTAAALYGDPASSKARSPRGSTLETLLAGLQTPAGARVVMDAGIATEDNLAWLRDPGYRYLVVGRRRRCDFDATRATPIRGRSGPEVQLCRSVDPATGAIFLACRSEAKSTKEPAILDRSAERFETALQKIHDGLSRPRARRRVDDVGRRIGRIQEKCRRAAPHSDVLTSESRLGSDGALFHRETKGFQGVAGLTSESAIE